MDGPSVESIIGYVDDLIFDARHVLEELDPFSNGMHPEMYSAISWLLPFVENSREWCSRLDSPLALFEGEADSFTPVSLLKLVLDYYRLLSVGK